MRADVGTCVERVNFEMRRGSATGAIEFSRNENIAPYSLVGDDGPLDFFPWKSCTWKLYCNHSHF